MIVQIVEFQSKLNSEKINELYKKRAPEYEKMPSLIQKYYVKTEDGKRFGGIYVWDSKESMEKFRNSELAASIPNTYQVVGEPEKETYEVAFPLRK
jgi:heme-degrading monooxygenase HmoA